MPRSATASGRLTLRQAMTLRSTRATTGAGPGWAAAEAVEVAATAGVAGAADGRSEATTEAGPGFAGAETTFAAAGVEAGAAAPDAALAGLEGVLAA